MTVLFRSTQKTLNAFILALACSLSISFGGEPSKPVSAQHSRPAPQWLRDGVIYELFPRDFSAAGNLPGVTARLDELKDLGVTILWIMPLHPIGEKFRKGAFGSPYSISDYYAIDPDYGTLGDFKKLVAEAHRRGLKLIMDLVAGHTSWDSVLMAHPQYYRRDAHGKVLPPMPEWTDVAGLNYGNPELRAYMIGVMKYWIQECDVDGFRCDVAYMVPTDFWEQARAELVKIKPDIMLLAEASKPELLVNAFDIDYSWPLLSAVNSVMLDGAPAFTLQKCWEQSMHSFPKDALHMRITDDHDEPRAIARFGVRGAMAASALMFTLDGVPLLYNGMEVGDATESGDPALFDKLPIFWHPKGRQAMEQTYRGLIQLRKDYSPFRSSPVEWVRNSDSTNLLTFLRRDEKDQFLVAINFCNRPVQAKVDVDGAGDFHPLQVPGISNSTSGALPNVRLGSFGWQIYHRTMRSQSTASMTKPASP